MNQTIQPPNHTPACPVSLPRIVIALISSSMLVVCRALYRACWNEMVTQPLSFPSTAFGGSVSKEADLAVHLQDSGREEFFEYCARSVFGLSAKRISNHQTRQ